MWIALLSVRAGMIPDFIICPGSNCKSESNSNRFYLGSNHISCNVQQLYCGPGFESHLYHFYYFYKSARPQIWLIQQYKTGCYLIQIYFSSFSTANLSLDLAVRTRTDNKIWYQSGLDR